MPSFRKHETYKPAATGHMPSSLSCNTSAGNLGSCMQNDMYKASFCSSNESAGVFQVRRRRKIKLFEQQNILWIKTGESGNSSWTYYLAYDHYNSLQACYGGGGDLPFVA